MTGIEPVASALTARTSFIFTSDDGSVKSYSGTKKYLIYLRKEMI